MFLNQYHHSFDEKFRLTIPAKFRELPEGAYIVQGLDPNLLILPPEVFDTLYKHLMAMNFADQNVRILRDRIFSTAHMVVPDANGRILIPQNLRDLGELKHDVVFVGAGNHIEVWSEERWQKHQELLNDTETNDKRFAAINLTLA
jgi:transcriptional regulator MraZ